MANQGRNGRGPGTLFQDIITFENATRNSITTSPAEQAGLRAAVEEELQEYEIAKGGKSKLLRGPMRHLRAQEITCSDKLKLVFESIADTAATFPDNLIKAKLDSLFGLWTTINSLKQIDRFLSQDQPTLLGDLPTGNDSSAFTPVNPDRHPAFETETKLQRLVIRLLHSPGLITFDYELSVDPERLGMKVRGIDAIKNLYSVGRLLLIGELNRVEPNDADEFPRTFSNSAAFWIRDTRKNIATTLEAVATLACYREDPTEDELRKYILDMRNERVEAGLRPLSEGEEEEEKILKTKMTREIPTEEGLRANFAEKGVNFLEELQREMTARLMEESDLDPLVMDLLRREDEFEAALSVEHFEDKLVNKQISLLAEQEIAENRSWAPYLDLNSLEVSLKDDGALKDWETVIFSILRDMGLVNRHRRDFRLLRDWAGKRPWKQIYQLYDSTNRSAEPLWVSDGIKLFDHKVVLPFDDIEIEDNYVPYPTSIRKVLPRLFGFLPINAAKKENKSRYGCDFRRESCKLCKKRYYQGRNSQIRGFSSTIIELHCTSQHKFHMQCIFDFWDGRGKYLHTCPTCGEMAKLNYETVGIDPNQGGFLHNNQNYDVASLVVKSLNSDNARLARKAKELYNVPVIPVSPRAGDDPMDVDRPALPVTETGMRYFQSEISRRAALAAMPLVWEHVRFGAGINTSTWRITRKTNSILDPVVPRIFDADVENILGYDNPYYSDYTIETRERQEAFLTNELPGQQAELRRANRIMADEVAKRTGDMFLKGEFDRGRDDVYDVDSIRILPAARLSPSMESAFMRGARRRRDFKLRKKIRNEGRGLGGLG